METVTISKQEYEDLLSYKEAFKEAVELNKQKGKSYKKYRIYKQMDDFFSRRYNDRWQAMKEIFYNNCPR